MLHITKILLKNKNVLIKGIWVIIILSLLLFVYSIFNLPPRLWDTLGRDAGNISVYLFLLVITPGIIKRFGVKEGILQDVQLVLMGIRRQLGISMYLSAIMHSLWIRNMGLFMAGILPTPRDLHQLLGTIALTLTFPLFITSNDFSQEKLGKWWYTIHKLVYIIHWFIFGHVVLVPGKRNLSLLILSFALLEIIGSIKKRYRDS